MTEPPEHWFFKRNKLRPDSLKLDLCIPSSGNWRVDLSRHDNPFNVLWRPNDDLRIDAQQLRYRKLVKWPRMQRLTDFPLLVGQLEECLEIQFLRHVDFGARLLKPNELARNAKIQHWLAPCADTFGWDRRMLIEHSGLGSIKTADQLPPPELIDEFMNERIEAVMATSQGLTYTKRPKGGPNTTEPLFCSYGRAQKLVNMYLKLKIVCAGHHDHPHTKGVHPPLDAVLLKALDSAESIDQECDLEEFRRKLKTAKKLGTTWTTFDRATYDAYIEAIRLFQGRQPLWAVERLWNPERDAIPV